MSERPWFIFGVYPDGRVDVSDGEGDVLTHVTKEEADRVIDRLAAAEREVERLREEVMAPCDCPAHLDRARALSAERARDEAVAALRALLGEIRIEVEAKGGSKRQALARLELAEARARAVLEGGK